jgi:SHS family lactate transporter-like MFS transporter
VLTGQSTTSGCRADHGWHDAAPLAPVSARPVVAFRPVSRRVQVRLDVPADEVRRRATRVLAELGRGRLGELEFDVRPVDEHASLLELHVAPPVRVPYFGWFVRAVAWWAARGDLRDALAGVRADLADAAPPRRRRQFLVPPAHFSAAQAASLATVAAVGAFANFGGSLLGQGGSAVIQSFGRSDAALSFALALTRIGVLVALVASALADRYGRRRVLLFGLAGICVANAVAAFAPNFTVFTVAQVLVRGFVDGTLVVAGIVAIEEAPEGARAFALSMLALALGFGFAISVVLLPLADIGTDGWRLMFLLSALALVALPGLARHLPESRRYARLSERPARRRLRDEAARYGGRFLLLGAVAFLLSVFAAPSTQLTNRYLTHIHYFSNSEIAGFRALTAGVPGFLGIVLAGHLVETRGRRWVSVVALVVATVSLMAFFVTGGSLLWVTETIYIVAAASAGVAVGALDVELFPTEVRGSTSGVLLVCGVAGSVTGLLLTTILEGPAGGLGPAIALCGLAPLLAALVLLPFVPETAAQRLDDISPTQG